MKFSKIKNSLKRPEFIFPLIILIVGLILVVITPIGANFDEETYIARIYEMASGYVMPNSYIGTQENYPLELFSNSYRQDVNYWPIDGPTWLDQVKDRIDWENIENEQLIKYKTRAVYFPTLFVIQAIIMRVIGFSLNTPIVFIYYVIRFSYLILYILLVYFALRFIPFGKWVLGVMTVGPMALISATAVSPDPIIFGVCFLFIAWILFLIKNSHSLISNKHLIITCALILTIGMLKPNYIFLLFLLLALPYQGYLKKKDVVILLVACVLSVGISLWWSYMASQVIINELNAASDSTSRFWSLFQTPQVFIKSLMLTIYKNIVPFIRETIGVSGYGYWHLPTLLYVLYPAVVLISFFIEENHNYLTRNQKLIFWLTGFINFLVIFVLLFIANTPINSSTIVGVQGRYFIPFIPLFFVPIVFVKPVKIIKILSMVLIGFVLLISVITLFLDFHVMCGESLTSKNPCKLPYYKNWGPETFISANLPQGSAIIQNIIVDCQTISNIEIWPLQNDEKNDQHVIVNIRTGDGALLGSSSFSITEVSLNKWFSIDIPDVVGMKGTAISIEILPAEGQDLSQFVLGVFPTNEYTKGELFLKYGSTGKSTTADNDLIFKYQCEKPW
ncbi:MAG TPA: hypothetical protein DIW44_02345 [Anaerolineaceae bacterium]|nr:hypothetical protein [Anaerolineaceae bacterium]